MHNKHAFSPGVHVYEINALFHNRNSYFDNIFLRFMTHS